jgi:regulator of replication initiation timing/predicted O-methyltransferase YrrM
MDKPAPVGLKSVARRLPIIGDVVSERDRLRDDVARLVSERDRLRSHCGQVVSEHEKLSREHEKLASRFNASRAECEETAHQRDELRRRHDRLLSAYDKLLAECGIHPPGHFHSPIPAFAEIRQGDSRLFHTMPRSIAGIDMHEDEQLELLGRFRDYYETLPFKAGKAEGLRYYLDNPAYSYSDGILLHCMLRHLKPRRIVEVGSGFSSALILDTAELFFDDALELSVIDPDPQRLLSLIQEGDRDRFRLVSVRLQDVDLGKFGTLEANDILFIDSTHVSKLDSDVNRLFFTILPVLASGVHVHFHDVIYPFEYPKDWFELGRAWNEAYVLRAFLQYNEKFRIVLMNTFMEHFHEEFFRESMPLCLKNLGGSIWLRKE